MLAEQTVLSAYRIMWLYVMFDLPTETKRQRKDAATFRKNLLKDGFVMHQYSVYIRHCASNETMDVHCQRVKHFVPDEGLVSILRVTDKQYSDTIQFVGKKRQAPQKVPCQLELF